MHVTTIKTLTLIWGSLSLAQARGLPVSARSKQWLRLLSKQMLWSRIKDFVAALSMPTLAFSLPQVYYPSVLSQFRSSRCNFHEDKQAVRKLRKL